MVHNRQFLHKGQRDRTSPARIARTTLEAECLRLRAKGYSFTEIGEMVGMECANPGARVEAIILAALERKGKPDAEKIRTEQYERLDKLFNRAARIATSDAPDRVAALNAAVSISARMASLTGADAPKVLDANVNHNHVAPAPVSKLVERLAAELGEEGSSEGS